MTSKSGKCTAFAMYCRLRSQCNEYYFSYAKIEISNLLIPYEEKAREITTMKRFEK